jgi:hypothetical protein
MIHHFIILHFSIYSLNQLKQKLIYKNLYKTTLQITIMQNIKLL